MRRSRCGGKKCLIIKGRADFCRAAAEVAARNCGVFYRGRALRKVAMDIVNFRDEGSMVLV